MHQQALGSHSVLAVCTACTAAVQHTSNMRGNKRNAICILHEWSVAFGNVLLKPASLFQGIASNVMIVPLITATCTALPLLELTLQTKQVFSRPCNPVIGVLELLHTTTATAAVLATAVCCVAIFYDNDYYKLCSARCAAVIDNQLRCAPPSQTSLSLKPLQGLFSSPWNPLPYNWYARSAVALVAAHSHLLSAGAGSSQQSCQLGALTAVSAGQRGPQAALQQS
eukprot:11401-Heterococcus_DN1.PRE.1